MDRANRVWSQVYLGAHVDLLTGHPFKSAEFTVAPDDIRLLRGDNISQGTLRWETAKRWPIGQTAEFEKFRLQVGDVVLAMDRPWISAGLKYAWVKQSDRPSLLVQRVARMRGMNGLSTDYLRYLIGSPQFTDHVMSIITGVNVPHISARDIKAFRFRLPPTENQCRVAAILSTYDDLIENNMHRIVTLEEVAWRLYEEWFVHFRFPGHEDVKMVESELGPVPEGWRIAPFVAIADVLSGGTPKKTDPAFWGGSIPFYTPKDAPSSAYILATENYITEGGLAKCNSKLYPKDTVFITARGTVGKVTLASEDMAMNQSCYALRPRDGFGPLFLFLATRAAVRELRTRTHGAVFATIIVDTFRRLQAIKPKKEVAQRFEKKVRPLFDMVLNLQRKNSNLRSQRDLLLPKLISGEIDVSEVGEPTVEAAAE